MPGRARAPHGALPLTALWCVAIACASDQAPPITTQADSAGVRIITNDVARSDTHCLISRAPVRRIGVATGAPEHELFEAVDAARLSDGSLAVLNAGTSEVRVFLTDGSFGWSFGRRGSGPGEFRSVLTLDVLSGDTLVVGDYRPWRYSLYSSRGLYHRSVSPAQEYPNVPRVIEVAPDGGGFFLGQPCCGTPERGFAQQVVHVSRYDWTGQRADSLGSFYQSERGWLDRSIRFAGSPIFSPVAGFAATDTTLVYASGIEPVLELRRWNGALRALVRWSDPDRTVRPEDIAEFRRSWSSRLGQSSPRLRSLVEARISDDRPAASRFPAHGGILAGGDGSIWIREFGRPLDPPVSRWLVFRQDGVFECHVETPASLELYEIGSDYVLGRVIDGSGVEFIEEYRLDRSPQPPPK